MRREAKVLPAGSSSPPAAETIERGEDHDEEPVTTIAPSESHRTSTMGERAGAYQSAQEGVVARQWAVLSAHLA